MRAVTDQIAAVHLLECPAQQRPVVRIVPAQEGLVQPTLTSAFGNRDLLLLASYRAKRVVFAVVHRRSVRHGGGQKGLHLIGLKSVLFKPKRELEHVFIPGAGVSRDKIGD